MRSGSYPAGRAVRAPAVQDSHGCRNAFRSSSGFPSSRGMLNSAPTDPATERRPRDRFGHQAVVSSPAAFRIPSGAERSGRLRVSRYRSGPLPAPTSVWGAGDPHRAGLHLTRYPSQVLPACRLGDPFHGSKLRASSYAFSSPAMPAASGTTCGRSGTAANAASADTTAVASAACVLAASTASKVPS